ncbi:MAG: hypothetical protein OXH51_01065 [Gemmatimonadetes bacterium]|nr:hypothetical protein [Gemmatimonadota bacterium]MCY3610099.1 hypothetical protein [Gemmatimonadota bacterium]MCY3676072.1 hypothetical protein [Gemmatimonadota bacterium]MYA42257.1 hypothetical protein [Gemmatimonadota bacterium]MYE94127.1 hypothetical protein [Gemmatimonadota bacterium]
MSNARATGTARSRSGYSIIEIAVVLVVLGALAPPLLGSARQVRTSFYLERSREEAARLFAEARWAAVVHGGSTVELATDPARGVVIVAGGDTVMAASLDEGGVTLGLSRGRATARVRFGPMGVGMVSSQTLRFGLAGEERLLVLSSLGRVSRR